MKLHDSILCASGGAWHNPPARVRWSAEQKRVRDAIIDAYERTAAKSWGFKDPRTMFVLDGWRAALPELRLVGTFRHHDCVVQSLLHRNPELFTKESAAQLWYIYNSRLLSIARSARCALVAFDGDDTQLRAHFKAVTEALHLRPPRLGLRFFRTRLRHFRPRRDQHYPLHIENLYEQLCRFSEDSIAARPGESSVAAA